MTRLPNLNVRLRPDDRKRLDALQEYLQCGPTSVVRAAIKRMHDELGLGIVPKEDEERAARIEAEARMWTEGD